MCSFVVQSKEVDYFLVVVWLQFCSLRQNGILYLYSTIKFHLIQSSNKYLFSAWYVNSLMRKPIFFFLLFSKNFLCTLCSYIRNRIGKHNNCWKIALEKRAKGISWLIYQALFKYFSTSSILDLDFGKMPIWVAK